MTEQPAESLFETRLRVLLASELHRAELDYTRTPQVAAKGSRSQRVFLLVAIAVGLLAVASLANPWAGPPFGSIGDGPGASGSLAPSTSPPCRTALAEGFLVSAGGALVLQGATGEAQAIEWPTEYRIREDGGSLRLVDPSGTITAREGDFVRVGGGFGNDDVFHGCGDITVVPRSLIESPRSGTTIDGFKLGVAANCSPGVGSIDPSLVGSSCAGQQTLAISALDTRDPAHAAVIRVARYTDGTQPEPVDVTGNAPTPTPAPTEHPGPVVSVFVFVLADGSVRATGVACPDARSCVGIGAYPVR